MCNKTAYLLSFEYLKNTIPTLVFTPYAATKPLYPRLQYEYCSTFLMKRLGYPPQDKVPTSRKFLNALLKFWN